MRGHESATEALGRGAAVPTPTRRDETARRIKELVLRRGLQPGDPMPTETELCELLGVSRSSVREAVRTLSTLDIVEVRHGRGTFVGEMRLDALVETLVFRGVITAGDDVHALREVVEVRQTLDDSVAERVTASFRDTENPELHALVDEMVEAAERGETFLTADRAFHAALLARIDNTLVGQLVTAFWDVHSAVMPRLGLQLPDDLSETARAHGDMLRAAEAGDAAAFRAAVTEHYAPLRRMLDNADLTDDHDPQPTPA
ncbi:FadR/GntR family transcriptional regulator [Sanguibacter sp. HDW7]|uniref:FadR/GntR family transcriptional regulator n=1 Tax=Sanguibacter sp. HDW7 TaxID=2714931 RepID=UPI00140E1FA0|nr:FCD domain-containing protein [Sanguibacter sp. HDW7]QIK84244.1 FadR family transcriptional regulator [Sanguibacter sp. HDW7]